jgi:hypothetical protein
MKNKIITAFGYIIAGLGFYLIISTSWRVFLGMGLIATAICIWIGRHLQEIAKSDDRDGLE